MKSILNDRSLKGKSIAVTGSTGGLGTALCEYLTALGAELILLDRNPQKAAALQSRLKDICSDVKITRITVDLTDIGAVKSAVERLIALRPDIFIHNAGAYSIPRTTCTTGLDNVFQINFASPYYIIRELKSALPDIKIVAVGSIAHRYSKYDPEDIDFSTRKSAALTYGNAKRYLMLALHDYFGDGSSLAITHPGITFTNITAHYPPLIFAIIKHPMKVIFMKPKSAALCILEGIFRDTPYGHWIGPTLFDIWGRPRLKKFSAAFGDEAGQIGKIAESIYSDLKEENRIERK